MPDPLDAAPASFTAGDTVAWYQAVVDTPPPTWTLTVRLTGPASLEKQATNASGRHLVTFSATETAALPSGTYRWAARAASGAEAYTVADGVVTVVANPVSLTGDTGLSFAAQMLAKVEARLLELVDDNVSQYTVEQREVRKRELAELEAARAKYAAEVRRQRTGGRIGTPVLVTFRRAGMS